MNFNDQLKIFIEKIPEKQKYIDSEETTKTSLILPFLGLMGYDFTNPAEVKAEYTADIGSKKGEKIDLAILLNNKPEMLIECKPAYEKLDLKHISQLYRYFNITNSKIGILTNGLDYKFFTDSKNPGKMDEKPFLEINMLDLSKKDIIELEKFTKENYNLTDILKRVDVLKYSNEIKKVINNEINLPSDDFTRVIAKQVYDGVLTKKPLEMFRKLISDSFNQSIKEKVDKRLKSALEGEGIKTEEITINVEEPKIITTQVELEAWYIIRSIAAEITNPERVFIRDRQSYCGILLDNNQNYPIVRLHFNNAANLVIKLFDSIEIKKSGAKKGERIHLDNISDIYNYKDRIQKSIRQWDIIIENKNKK